VSAGKDVEIPWQSEADRHSKSVRRRWPGSNDNKIKPSGLPPVRHLFLLTTSLDSKRTMRRMAVEKGKQIAIEYTLIH